MGGFYVIRDPVFVYFWLVPLQWGLMFHFRSGGLSTSIGLFGSLYAWYVAYGWTGVLHELLSLFVGASFGVYLFHLQHSVNPAYRVHRNEHHDKIFWCHVRQHLFTSASSRPVLYSRHRVPPHSSHQHARAVLQNSAVSRGCTSRSLEWNCSR